MIPIKALSLTKFLYFFKLCKYYRQERREARNWKLQRWGMDSVIHV